MHGECRQLWLHIALLCYAGVTLALHCTAGMGWLTFCIVGWIGKAGSLHYTIGLEQLGLCAIGWAMGQLQPHAVKHYYESKQADGLKTGFIHAGLTSTP